MGPKGRKHIRPFTDDNLYPIHLNVTIGRRRDRLVYFRISEDEFADILKACESRGTRSVSDLARSAVQEFIKPPKSETDQQMFEMMKTLRTLLDDVASTVKQLASTSAESAASAGSDTPARQEKAAGSSNSS
jgi:hypothetical protein